MRLLACASILAAAVALTPAAARADSLFFGKVSSNHSALEATFFDPSCTSGPGLNCDGTLADVNLLAAQGITLNLTSGEGSALGLHPGDLIVGSGYKGSVGASGTLRWTFTSSDPVWGISCLEGTQVALGVCDQTISVPSGYPPGQAFGTLVFVHFDPVGVAPGKNQLLHITMTADLLDRSPDFLPADGAALQEGVTSRFNVLVPTPEPASLLLLGTGLAIAEWRRRSAG